MKKLRIKKALTDGTNAMKKNPVIILLGLVYAILAVLISPTTENGFMNLFSSSNILKIVITSLVAVFISALMIVLSADGKKFSLITAANLVTSKYATLLLSNIISFILFVLGFIAFVIPGIFLFIKLSYFDMAILLDKKGPIQSLKFSWKITRNNWWRIFGLVVVITLISWLFLYITDVVFGTVISDFAYWTLLFPWMMAVSTHSYLQLRKR